METENIGLLKGIECRYVKTDPELIDEISQRREIPTEKVKKLMRYNIFTIQQFSALTGLAISSILNKTRISMIEGKIDTDLDYCHPFQDKEGRGPKFIVRNEKSEKYLKPKDKE